MNQNNILTIDDWRVDKYRWINQGVTRLPRKNPSLKKHYFAADTPQGASKNFQRHAYQLLSDKSITLIHYVGDEKVAVDFCHRSTRQHSNQAFTRTLPSSMRKYEELCKSDKANVVYKRAVASMDCNPEHVAVQTPRNMKQLRNLRFKHLHQTRISRDALYNIHELAYDTPGFVWKITTFPDLVCICGLQVRNQNLPV